ncbi:RHS domain-containing protein [Kosakonia cowanii]|uniref:RHS domain-containing protein n=1 Tax=Kosakonia cowanii TaxID=208223 RepID=UPI002DDD8F86|nr:RHS domain-containing protein [Kosakonia cowanii]WRY61525.1 RHS domain-containing protein [Kosakonia cowanii]
MDIFWYHTELNGVPEGVTDSNGNTAWRGTSTARAVACAKDWRLERTSCRTCASGISTWTEKRACTTTPSVTTTRSGGRTDGSG